ncbi:MAG: CopG family transcriptional regulator [Omnitrophica WOR_2 bacterium GWA2_47_8]|nr:MAG: CopG family transcriptional regulator [Omnitrophica WOR_2 bacterium GWA2_47_8]
MVKIKKKKVVDSDMPVGKLIRIPDFLPPPDQLILSEPTVKVTLSLTKDSLEFFKRQAARRNTKYQKMIREVVDQYAKKYR